MIRRLFITLSALLALHAATAQEKVLESIERKYGKDSQEYEESYDHGDEENGVHRDKMFGVRGE